MYGIEYRVYRKCVKRTKEIHQENTLLQLSSLAFRRWVERCTGVCDRSRDNLANTHWTVAARPWCSR